MHWLPNSQHLTRVYPQSDVLQYGLPGFPRENGDILNREHSLRSWQANALLRRGKSPVRRTTRSHARRADR